jgi:peptide-methionine (R)-S-oxide reductase
MSDTVNTEEFWKKKLSEPVYRALKEGVMEKAGTGKYEKTTSPGWYTCAGCGKVLFGSSSKIDDGSGYATFREPVDDTAISKVATFDESGETLTRFVCASCGGRIGLLDTISLRSSLDMEQGTAEQLYHASSHALVLKKSLTFRNYPVGSVLVLMAVLIFAYFGWSWIETLKTVGELGRTDATIPFWVGDMEVQATVVRLDDKNASTSGMVVRQNEALLLVLGTLAGAPAIRFANHSVDILWLDENFTVVGWEHERASQNKQVLEPPTEARYALMAQPGTLSSQAFAKGFVIIVTDKSKLF